MFEHVPISLFQVEAGVKLRREGRRLSQSISLSQRPYGHLQTGRSVTLPAVRWKVTPSWTPLMLQNTPQP